MNRVLRQLIYTSVTWIMVLLISMPAKAFYPQKQDVNAVVVAAADQQQVVSENTGFSVEPEGYRLTDYRTPVPQSLTGAATLSTEDLETLLAKGQALQPLLIDVLPKTKKPEWWPAGQVWLPEPHQSIPSAVWLPEVGFGTINEAVETAYQQFLLSATNNNLKHPIVLFCRENCWISWNAAKRLLQYGYQQIYWYPDGIDGWLNNLNETQELKPKELL